MHSKHDNTKEQIIETTADKNQFNSRHSKHGRSSTSETSLFNKLMEVKPTG